MIKLVDVYKDAQSKLFLFQLLEMRLAEPDTNISHKRATSYVDHVKFVDSQPYKGWYLIYKPDADVPNGVLNPPLGAIYLSKQGEVGLSLFKGCRGRGIGSEALKQLIELHPGEPCYYANINPRNDKSAAFFKRHGFKFEWCIDGIQDVYIGYKDDIISTYRAI